MENKIVLPRARTPKGISALYLVGFIVSLILLGFGTLIKIKVEDSSVTTVFILMASLGVVLFITSIMGFSNVTKNRKVNKPCIEYDEENNILILNAFNGKVIKISPKKYISYSRSFNTDLMVVVKYFDEIGVEKKIKLGWASSLDNAIAFINHIRLLEEKKDSFGL